MNATIANPDAMARFSATHGSPATTKTTNMKIVINRCFGGFGLSEVAYSKLIEWGVPVKPYVEQKRDKETNRYLPEPANEGEIIFDRTLTPEQQFADAEHIRLMGRFWETWLDNSAPIRSSCAWWKNSEKLLTAITRISKSWKSLTALNGKSPNTTVRNTSPRNTRRGTDGERIAHGHGLNNAWDSRETRWPCSMQRLFRRLLQWCRIIRTPQRQVGGYHLAWDTEI